MEYLSKKDYVHQDLAARNCMLDIGHVVKVSDFGLTRHLYQQRFYQKTSNLPMPVRWIALEYFTDNQISTKSDVWSYGVVLWEVFNKGQTPYPTLHDHDVREQVIAGVRLEQTPTFPDDMYRLAQTCWRNEPDDRPSFTDIIDKIENLHANSLPITESIEMTTQSSNNNYLGPEDLALNIPELCD